MAKKQKTVKQGCLPNASKVSKRATKKAAKRSAKRVPKSGAVWHLSAEEATLAGKPRYNGFACGHGVHGSTKYDRAKSKRSWQKQIRKEGASMGPFDVYRVIRRELVCLARVGSSGWHELVRPV